jgi:alpha-aminoadipic semialdehyde synthase
MMGVDILPSELPREASTYFGDLLLPYVPALATAGDLETLPDSLRGAVVTDNGAIAPLYSYISGMRSERERGLKQTQMAQMAAAEGSSVFRLTGHLFDR